jgi:hypothetical protein
MRPKILYDGESCKLLEFWMHLNKALDETPSLKWCQTESLNSRLNMLATALNVDLSVSKFKGVPGSWPCYLRFREFAPLTALICCDSLKQTKCTKVCPFG